MAVRLVSFTIAEDPPPRLDKALARDVPADASLSRSRLARLIEDGAVRIDGDLAGQVTARVSAGALVEIVLGEAEESHILPEDIPLDVVFEDADLVVVNKRAGMVVHPAPGTPGGTLVNALLHHFGDDLSGVGGMKRPGIVHRIDKETSGLLVVAKTDAAHHALAEQFARHSVERAYRAVCFGVPEAGDPRLKGLRGTSFEAGNVLKIATGLARHKADRQKQAVVHEAGKHAVTRVRVDERFGRERPVAAAVTCWLETGRTHQIRVHMAYVGHGLIGDPVYGGRRKIAARTLTEDAVAHVQGFARQALHAATLGFRHPISGDMLRFEAPLPDDLAGLLQSLRG